eukprot:gene12077-15188_t
MGIPSSCQFRCTPHVSVASLSSYSIKAGRTPVQLLSVQLTQPSHHTELALIRPPSPLALPGLQRSTSRFKNDFFCPFHSGFTLLVFVGICLDARDSAERAAGLVNGGRTLHAETDGGKIGAMLGRKKFASKKEARDAKKAGLAIVNGPHTLHAKTDGAKDGAMLGRNKFASKKEDRDAKKAGLVNGPHTLHAKTDGAMLGRNKFASKKKARDAKKAGLVNGSHTLHAKTDGTKVGATLGRNKFASKKEASDAKKVSLVHYP